MEDRDPVPALAGSAFALSSLGAAARAASLGRMQGAQCLRGIWAAQVSASAPCKAASAATETQQQQQQQQVTASSLPLALGSHCWLFPPLLGSVEKSP